MRKPQRVLLVLLALALAPGGLPAQSADSAQEVKDLLARMMEEGGGEAAIKSLRGWRYKGVQTHRDANGEHINQVDVLVLLPDRIHIESRTSQGNVTLIYTPTQAFWVSGTQSGDLTAVDQQAFLQDIRTNPVNVLQHASEAGYSFRINGSEVVAGVSTRILQVIVPGAQATWYVDPASGRTLKTSQWVASASGSAERIREYADWRYVGDGRFPFRHQYSQKGATSSTSFEGRVEIHSIEFNPPTDARLFARPPSQLGSLPFSPATVSFTPPAPLPPQKAALRISAQPGGAQVYLDDEPRGTTSSSEGRLVLKDLAPGSYRLRLTLAEHKDWTQTITLNPGGELALEARLVPRGPAPFTAQDIVDMLQGGVSPKRVATLVQQQGVDFTLTDETESRLRDAGADASLLLTIAKGKK